MTFTNEVT